MFLGKQLFFSLLPAAFSLARLGISIVEEKVLLYIAAVSPAKGHFFPACRFSKPQQARAEVSSMRFMASLDK